MSWRLDYRLNMQGGECSELRAGHLTEQVEPHFRSIALDGYHVFTGYSWPKKLDHPELLLFAAASAEIPFKKYKQFIFNA
jgi:hypothetical protein